MIVRFSALKHGIEDDDSIAAATWPIVTVRLDDEIPQRVMRIRFDTRGRLIEVAVLRWDNGTEEIIHAMKARPQFAALVDG